MMRFAFALLILGIALGTSLSYDADGENLLSNYTTATEIFVQAPNVSIPESPRIESIVNKGVDFAVFTSVQVINIGMELGFKHPTYGTTKTLVWIALLLIISPLIPTFLYAALILAYLLYKGAEWTYIFLKRKDKIKEE